MSTQIRHLFTVIVVLFALLVVWTTRWTVFEATALNHNPLNVRTLIATLKIKRGRILADNGPVLARSVKQQSTGYWLRTYPGGSLFSQAVGYSDLRSNQSAGLEQYRLDDLKGPHQAPRIPRVDGRGRLRVDTPQAFQQGPRAALRCQCVQLGA